MQIEERRRLVLGWGSGLLGKNAFYANMEPVRIHIKKLGMTIYAPVTLALWQPRQENGLTTSLILDSRRDPLLRD